jgi:hypothetical protein
MKQGIKCLKPFFLILFSFLLTFNIYSQSWNAFGSGTNGIINAAIVFNNELIVAGSFTTAGGVTRNNIARWSGTAWNSLGTGTNDTVFALAIFNSQLIAAGAFTTAGGVSCNRIASWNGSSWSPLGIGANSSIYAISNIGAYLRAGGRFSTIGGIGVNNIARWDGVNWTAMGTGTNAVVYAFCQFGNDLIIGGAFTSAGGITANRIVRYNLTSGAWATVGAGIDNNAVYAVGTFNNNLYVGGNFTLIGGITINNIARWTGTNWNNLGTGTNGIVRSMYTNGNASIIIGGGFTTANGGTVNCLTNYNGTTFSAFGNGITGGTPQVRTITNWSNVLIAAGSFTTAGASLIGANNVAGWGAIPAAPILVSPSDGANGITVTPLLTWQAVSLASSYGLQMATNANFTSTIINVASILQTQYQVTAGSLQYNTVYFWRVNASNGLGTGAWSLVRFFTTALTGIIKNEEIPLRFSLYQNYPNPFNPVTRIKFDLPINNESSSLKLSVYSIDGEKVADILNTEYTAGAWEIDYNAASLASGIYLYKIEAGKYTQTNKMILIK